MSKQTYTLTLSTGHVYPADRDVLDAVCGKGTYSVDGTTLHVASKAELARVAAVLTRLVIPTTLPDSKGKPVVHKLAMYAPTKAEHTTLALTHKMWKAHGLIGMRADIAAWAKAYDRANRAARAKRAPVTNAAVEATA